MTQHSSIVAIFPSQMSLNHSNQSVSMILWVKPSCLVKPCIISHTSETPVSQLFKLVLGFPIQNLQATSSPEGTCREVKPWSLTNVTPSCVPLLLFTIIKTLPPLIPASVQSERVSKLRLVGFYFLLFASCLTIHHRFLLLDTFTLPFSSDLHTFHPSSPFPLIPLFFTPSLAPLLSFSLPSSFILTVSSSRLPPLSSSLLTCLSSTHIYLHFSRCHHDHRRRVRDGDKAWSTALYSKSPLI